MACFRNFWAYTLFSVVWTGVFALAGIVVTTVAAVTGNPAMLSAMLLPVALLIVAMFFTSIYFTFTDSFVDDTDNPLVPIS